ncbi:MAG: choice-of-anchor D domain-containing protein, partial [bacterium]
GDVSEACPYYDIISGGGPFSLTAGQSVTVTVRFEPTASGTQTCTIETGQAICADVACTGYGEPAPVCSVAPDTLDFGTVLIGNYVDTTFTITNTGGDTLSGDVSESCPHYDIISGGGPFNLTAGQSVTVTVRFEPTAAGTQTCTIETGQAVCTDVGCTGVGEEVTGIEGVTCTYNLNEGIVELIWTEVPAYVTWRLFRREGDGLYEFLKAYSMTDHTGTIQFIDRNVEEGITYRYRLEADGRPELFIETDEIDIPVTQAHLYQNFPNPFNPVTTITFTVPGGDGDRSGVLVMVYDVRGNHVCTLVRGTLPGGRHTTQWDGRNDHGDPVASGVYFVRLNVGEFKATRKMVFLR